MDFASLCIGAGPLKPVLITSIIKCIQCLLVNDIDLLEYPSLYSVRLLDKVQGEVCVTPRGRRRCRHKWVLNGYNWQWPLLALWCCRGLWFIAHTAQRAQLAWVRNGKIKMKKRQMGWEMDQFWACGLTSSQGPQKEPKVRIHGWN